MFLTLPVEFLTHPLAPLSAQLPNPTRITDVCTLQSNLQAKTERYTHEVHVVSMFEKKKNAWWVKSVCEYTCRIKCLCEASWRSRSWLSRCSLKVNRNSFCRLMSVARMREPSCCSMSCLQSNKTNHARA